MNPIPLLQYSLGNAFAILSQVTEDLTQEQADWKPPGIANPIGATYWHAVEGADYIVHKWCAGQTPLSESAGWKEKVLLVAGPESKEMTLAQMQCIRVDLPVLHQYAQAVAEATQAWLGSLSPEDLEGKKQSPIGEVSLGQILETFVIWHINAHCGEISALKGCLGVKGYPF